MTVRIERDPAFWTAVAAHPAVVHTLHGLAPEFIGQLALRDDMLPLAAEHGGFLVAKTDPLGFVAELHTLFTPEGWGREVTTNAVEGLRIVFGLGFQVLTTFEVRSNPRSRPARSFGFIRSGDWRETQIGEIRMWTITAQSWRESAVWRRVCQ